MARLAGFITQANIIWIWCVHLLLSTRYPDRVLLPQHQSIIGEGQVSSAALQGFPVVFKWGKIDDIYSTRGKNPAKKFCFKVMRDILEIKLVNEKHNREYEALRRLWSEDDDAYTIKVYDRGLDKQWQFPFLVLERVPFADTRCPTEYEDIPVYILQILKVCNASWALNHVKFSPVSQLQAVSHCHKHGIIHHDIKEDNILWQPYQKVCLLSNQFLA